MQQKFTGKIQSWNAERAFGFIQTDDKTKIFFHLNTLQSPHIPPKIGEIVHVLATSDTKGWKAVAVGSSERRGQQQKMDYGDKAKFYTGVMGKITRFNTERGFGVIEVAEPKTDVLFHIKKFQNAQNQPPKIGEMVQLKAELNGE